MSEAIREILFHVTPDGIEPSGPQPAGIQGEHNATEVKFQLDEALVKDGYFYRFEFVDGTGGMYTTDFVTPEGNAVAVKIPAAWTASGGCGTLRLCVAELSEDYQEEMVVLSFAGRLLFSGRDSTSPLYSYYEPGLSGLIESTHAAAENANTAADEAREAAQGADEAAEAAQQAKTAADSAAQGAREAEADAEAAADEARKAKADADAASADAVQAAEEAREAAGEAGRAADAADEAAADASAVAQTVQNKLDAGEFKGEKGDKGDQGDPGVSGVYVGSGAMPEGYNVQVDPDGELTCYTADEADALFLKKAEATDGWTKGEADDRFANALRGTASGELVRLDDVSPVGALTRAAVLGATTETGEGEKSPDNPYTLSGAKPAALTVCGRNLFDIDNPLYAARRANQLTRYPKIENGVLYSGGEAGSSAGVSICVKAVEAGSYSVTAEASGESGFAEISGFDSIEDNLMIGYKSIKTVAVSAGSLSFSIECEQAYFGIAFFSNTRYGIALRNLQIESGAATLYEPYAGQSVSLPEGLELYGVPDGTADEYDALSGVYTRRLKRVVLAGSETVTELPQFSNEDSHLFSIIGQGFDGQLPDYSLSSLCSHLPNTPVVSGNRTATGYELNPLGNNVYIRLRTDTGITDAAGVSGWLTAQAEAGTPVSFVFPAAETAAEGLGDPARIAPPAPVCQVYADAGTVEVAYNRDVNLAMAACEARLAALEEAAAALLGG